MHVVERVETYDHISRNRFVTRYAYHHGYFDGVEREFRGFGMVEQWDTEEFAALSASDAFPEATNIDAASHVPPVHTKTWFHTGVYLGRDHVSTLRRHSAKHEYYGESDRDDPASTDAARARVPCSLAGHRSARPDLTLDEEREACRALKGSMLRQEVYALDGTRQAQTHPYTVTEQNFTIRRLQPQGDNRHAVFFTHAREAISYHYERNPADPRVEHALTLEVDDFGNVLKSVAIGYGRRQELRCALSAHGDANAATNPHHLHGKRLHQRDRRSRRLSTPRHDPRPMSYRTPSTGEARTYELTGLYDPSNGRHAVFRLDDDARHVRQATTSAHESMPQAASERRQRRAADVRRLIEHVRTLYRKRRPERLACRSGTLSRWRCRARATSSPSPPACSTQVFQRRSRAAANCFCPNPAAVLGGRAATGGHVADSRRLCRSRR